MSLLKTEDLSLKINGQQIFTNININIEPHTVHALIGINGCGKSSIASVLMGIKKPTSGKIYFENEDITELNITERAQRGITLAWQEPVRFEGLTVKQYLGLSAKTKDQEKIYEGLSAVGLVPEKYINRDVDKSLSGGERKRIELASIYLMKPKLAILDEIDSGVDFIGIDNVIDTIKNIAKDGSVLLITHQDEFLKLSDQATLMCNGLIIKTGDPQVISKFYRRECEKCPEDNGPRPELEALLNG